VRVGVFVFAGTGVSEGTVVFVGGVTGVFVAGGAMTVRVPFDRLNGIDVPSGSVAAAFPRDKVEGPALAFDLIVNVMLATVPFEIAAWLKPNMMTRTLLGDGVDQERNLPAEDAVEPIDTF